MLSVEEALQLVRRNTPAGKAVWIPLEESLGFVLAREVRTPIALPAFDNSAMDGYGLRSADTRRASAKEPVRLKIAGDLQAGPSKKNRLRAGETCRIMTGAKIPAGADTVLIKERARVAGGELLIDAPMDPGHHLRRKGEEIKKGALVLSAGAILHPGTIGFLATIGKARVPVFSKPRVCIITTGSELTRPGLPLRPGMIYESNSWMIRAALQAMGMPPADVFVVGDDVLRLRRIVRDALKTADVVILTGGVSVGKYDYVKSILQECRVKKIFWRVKQKPGKPVYFGKKKQTLVFGLPGNPASVFTCFYQYVYPALRRMCGALQVDLKSEMMPLGHSVRRDPGKTLLLKGRVRVRSGRREAQVLHRQGSHMLSSLCEADAFIVIPPGGRMIAKGRKVRVDWFPLQEPVR